MAHVTKVKRGSVYNLLAHDDRTQEKNGNIDINPELTYMNVALTNGNSWENYKAVMDSEEVHCHNRADVNTICSWIVTSPFKLDEIDEEILDRFFVLCDSFMTERYGKVLSDGTSNVVSSMVHYDETTPHLHYKFVPLVDDKKKGGFKVNAKEVIDRTDLQTFHKDLQEYLNEHELPLPVIDSITVDKDYNKSISDLKKETKEMEREKRSALSKIDAEIASKKELAEELNHAEEKKALVGAQVEGLLRTKSQLKDQIEVLEEQKDSLVEGLIGKIEEKQLKIKEEVSYHIQKTGMFSNRKDRAVWIELEVLDELLGLDRTWNELVEEVRHIEVQNESLRIDKKRSIEGLSTLRSRVAQLEEIIAFELPERDLNVLISENEERKMERLEVELDREIELSRAKMNLPTVENRKAPVVKRPVVKAAAEQPKKKNKPTELGD